MDLRDLPKLSPDGPPWALRAFGTVSLFIVLLSAATTDPTPALHGDGALVALGIAMLAGGIGLSVRRTNLPAGRRFVGLLIAGAGSCLLAGVQPDSAGFAGIYYVAVVAGMRLPLTPAVIAAGGSLAAEAVIIALQDHHPNTTALGLVFSVLPWFLITRLIRRLGERRDSAERLVEELRESRAAHAQSVAIAERGRLARDMHDVLAHSLSALALQLEGTRLLARDSGADPEVVTGLERAHRLASSGLAEARQAIAALRGDELPGPERLQDLADAFGPSCTLQVLGTRRELSSEAGLALYRTAQEALTNVRKHSAADRVEVVVRYAPDATTLTVADHGPGAPVMVGASRGYGLTGMRERAELVGGRLDAEPTADGFKVELWLPA